MPRAGMRPEIIGKCRRERLPAYGFGKSMLETRGYGVEDGGDCRKFRQCCRHHDKQQKLNIIASNIKGEVAAFLYVSTMPLVSRSLSRANRLAYVAH